MTTTLPPVVDNSAQELMDLERDYLLQNYARYPLVLARGKGCYVYDLAGKRYLDFITGIGVNALGHAHPRIVKVMREQAALMIHSSNLYYHPYQGPLAKRLCQMSGMTRVFFCNSGTEAIEGAIKMIHSHGREVNPEKIEIIALENSFHGRSVGALSITGQPKYRKDFEPLMPGVKFVPVNDVAALEAAFTERTAGIVMELIQGEGGINPLTQEFVAKARELADRYNALLVADETQCGVGRPGTYFAYQRAEQVTLPDVVVAAKPVACGLPLGFILANDKAAAAIRPGMHGTTFGGGPLACRVALEFVEMLDEMLPAIQRVGGYLQQRLTDLAARHSFVKEVRGYGLMVGMELTIPGKQIVLDAMAAGLLINCTHDTVLRFLPPYIATEKEVDQAVKILTKLFAGVRPDLP
ncbi:MAG TPA: aspartate aminotransferase family protein [Candidatus Sulfopaludibacter sp.]|jgi:predicted acetylornithine/succinylornithine family transaminase|nr:aspartate aminotransferase family protein [Candidatus Sulfopaludibacter sp.]